jgi:hypothetical protein
LSGTDIVEEDEGTVDASDCIVSDARLDGGHSGVDDVGHGCERPEGSTGKRRMNEQRGQERASSKRELNVGEIELAGRSSRWSIWRSNWRRHVISLASSDR